MKQAVIISFLLAFISCGVMGSGDDRPDIPGKIVFSAKDGEGTSQIYTMNADGSDLEQLTHFGPEGGATHPAWSPDGKRIVFENYTGATTLGPYLYVMDSDGTNMRPLKKRQRESISALIGSAPAWSPDGTNIAYQVCTNCELGGRDYEIVVVEVEGEQYDSSQVHAVTDHPARDMNPTWSPDGQRIAFVSDRDYAKKGGTDIYLIEIEGGNITRVTKTGNAGRQLWSPIEQLEQLIYWSENNLYKLNLAKEEAQFISLDFDKETGFRPLAILQKQDKILLQVFNYTNPQDKQSLQILDLSEHELTPIYFNSEFHGADWYRPQVN